MEQRKPTIIHADVKLTELSLEIRVDATIFDFRGHFTSYPLLPGVTQIDWALFYAIKYLKVPTSFKGMEVIKFQEPILPDAKITLYANWDVDKQKLAFKYCSFRAGEAVIHSSGKMKLGEPGE